MEALEEENQEFVGTYTDDSERLAKARWVQGAAGRVSGGGAAGWVSGGGAAGWALEAGLHNWL